MNLVDNELCLHIIATLSEGGNETLARDLISSWPSLQRHAVAVLGRQDGPMRPQFECMATLLTAPEGWPLSLGGLWRTWRWLGHNRPHSVISYTNSIQALPLCWMARLRGVSKVVMHVGNPPPTDASGRNRWAVLIHLCRIAGIPLMSCSNSVHQQLASLASLPKGSAPILNGCNTAMIAQRAAAARICRPSGDVRRLLMVARLDPIKDQTTLLRAFAAAQVPGWQLELVGDGPDRARLEAMALELGLDAATVFLGRRADIPELLGQADLFAFSTTAAEGFGIALIEAMAAGLPVIASDVPACREVLKDGAAGDLLPPADLMVWADCLRQLMTDSSGLQQLARRAQSHASSYDIRHTAEQWNCLLQG